MERRRGGLLELAAIVAAFAVFFCAVAVLHHVFRDPDEPARQQLLESLASMRSSPPPAVTFHSGDREVLLRSSADVARFLTLIVDADAVPAHHSHPAERLSFELAGDARVFLLGRDSTVAGEFWLQVPATGADMTLKRIRSPELESWLARHRIFFAVAPDE